MEANKNAKPQDQSTQAKNQLRELVENNNFSDLLVVAHKALKQVCADVVSETSEMELDFMRTLLQRRIPPEFLKFFQREVAEHAADKLWSLQNPNDFVDKLEMEYFRALAIANITDKVISMKFSQY